MEPISACSSEEVFQFVSRELKTDSRQQKAMVFDFDGVLASSTEDKIYKLTETPEEQDKLLKMAGVWGLNLEGYDTSYIRHLLYQEAAAELGKKIERGLAYEAADLAAKDDRTKIYVLTARSGRRAIERLHRFLDDAPFEVVEVYHVGRVPKDRQIELFFERLPNHKVYLFEDDLEQLTKINTLLESSTYADRYREDVKLVHINHGEPDQGGDWIREFADTVIRTGADLRGRVGRRIGRSDGETLDFALGHGRGLFTYYAGQRITSFRFFMIVMGALAAGLGSILVKDSGVLADYRNVFAIGFGSAFFVAGLVFYLLDLRNRELVDVAENLLEEAEDQLYSRGLENARTIHESNEREIPGRTFGAVFDAVFKCTMVIGVSIALIGLVNLS